MPTYSYILFTVVIIMVDLDNTHHIFPCDNKKQKGKVGRCT